MGSPQNQCDKSFPENRQVNAFRSKHPNDGCNLHPRDTNVTRVTYQKTNTSKMKGANDIKYLNQLKYRSGGSTSTSEDGKNLCTNYLNQKSEDSVNDQTSVSKEALSHDAKWEIMFDRLLAFKKKHGHCLVPNRYTDDHKLGSWISTQRKQYKALASGRYDATTLPPNRIKRLDDIGFAWNTSDPRRVDWEVRYSQLKEFFLKYGM
jgi:Helicase associated domain